MKKTHNIIRKDYLNLLELIIESESNRKLFNTLKQIVQVGIPL